MLQLPAMQLMQLMQPMARTNVANDIESKQVLRIAIHVRRGDYIIKNHHVLPLEYYKRCLDSIHERLKQETNIIFAIFSDCYTCRG